VTTLTTKPHFLNAARLAAAALLLAAGVTAQAGDIEAGKQKAVTCAACHGADGNSVNPEWPSIAGQHASYLVDTLNAFKEGKRNNVLMNAQAMILDDQAIEDVAAYFAAQTPAKRTADPTLAKAGERIYRGGVREREVSACIACHGPNGRGIAPAGYPLLAGQHAVYTAKQLRDYKSGARKSDGDVQMMRNITAGLTEEQIEAVAAYIEGLH